LSEGRRRVEGTEADTLEAIGRAHENVHLLAICPLHAVHGALTEATSELGSRAFAGVAAGRAMTQQLHISCAHT